MQALFTPLRLVAQAVTFLAPGFVVGLWLHKRHNLRTLYIPLVAGLAGCVIGYAAFWAYLLHPVVGGWLSVILLFGSWLAAIYVATNRPAREMLRKPDILWPIVLLLGVTLLYNAAFISCKPTPADYSCYNVGLPIDNLLPQLFADHVAQGQPRLPFGDWLSRDRKSTRLNSSHLGIS